MTSYCNDTAAEDIVKNFSKNKVTALVISQDLDRKDTKDFIARKLEDFCLNDCPSCGADLCRFRERSQNAENNIKSVVDAEKIFALLEKCPYLRIQSIHIEKIEIPKMENTKNNN